VDLPASPWLRPVALIAAIGLGIAAGLILNSLSEPPRKEPVAALEAPRVDPETLAKVAALRDEAEALTRAEVTLDERAHERWMPRVAAIEAALDDPATPAAIRHELDATISALESVGVLAPEAVGAN
jgi:hypothetical protein